jgi:inner membrane protein
MAGAVMARVGGDRRTPLAALTLMLAANAPDIDIFSVWLGSFASLAFRRGWTHGPIALVLLPLVVTGVVLGWDRWIRRRRDPAREPVDARWTLILAAIGCLSHPALDWLNTYGIRLLMPFSSRWFYGDAVFIIDPWWWVVLAATLALARRRASLRAVRVAGAAVLAYPLVLLAVSRAGDRIARRSAAEQGIAGVTEILYQPAPFNPLQAQLIAVTDEAYHFGTLRWHGDERVRFGELVIARGDWSDPRVIAAREDADVRDFLVWSRYPYAAIETNAAGTSVRFGDARFPPGRVPAGALSGLRVPTDR